MQLLFYAGCNIDGLLSGVQQILDIFVEKGFAYSATLTDVQPNANGTGSKFKVKLEGPANL